MASLSCCSSTILTIKTRIKCCPVKKIGTRLRSLLIQRLDLKKCRGKASAAWSAGTVNLHENTNFLFGESSASIAHAASHFLCPIAITERNHSIIPGATGVSSGSEATVVCANHHKQIYISNSAPRLNKMHRRSGAKTATP